MSRRALAIPAVVGWFWLVGLTVLAAFSYGVKRHHFEAAGLVFGAGLLVVAWFYRRYYCEAPCAGNRHARFHERLLETGYGRRD